MNELEDFRGLAYTIARDYFLPGADHDDVRQEAMIGVWKGLRDYRPGGASRKNFVALCVRRQLATAVLTATRVKHEPLNRAVRDVTANVGEDGLSLLDALEAPGSDPARIVEGRELLAALVELVARDLTPLEHRALVAAANGKSYREIALDVGGDTRYPDGSPRHKRVENALARARVKIDAVRAPALEDAA